MIALMPATWLGLAQASVTVARAWIDGGCWGESMSERNRFIDQALPAVCRFVIGCDPEHLTDTERGELRKMLLSTAEAIVRHREETTIYVNGVAVLADGLPV